MSRIPVIVLAALLLVLPGCIASIGNSPHGCAPLQHSTAAQLREAVAASQRIVELRRQIRDQLRQSHSAGRASTTEILEEEIALQQALIQTLEYEAALQAVLDDDDQHRDG